jgi:hypothetical protein
MNSFLDRPDIVALAVFVVSAAPVWGADFFWDGTTGNWNDPLNWSTDIAPGSSDAGRINNGGTALIDETGGAVTTGFVILADAPSTSGNLRMTGATSRLTTAFDIRIGGNAATTGGTGVFDQLAGEIVMNGGNVNVGFGTNTDGTTGIGTYNISSGSLQLSGSNIFAVGNRGVGTVNQSGGTIYVRGAGTTTGPATAILQLGRNVATVGASGTFTLSGGTAAATRVLFGNAVQTSGTASTNTFNLQGTGTLLTNEITIVNTAATNSFNFAGGTLRARAINIPLTNNGGTLSPAGFDLTISSADIAQIPINPVGTTTFSATNGYTQGASSNLAIDIAAPGSNDFVDIGSGASIASASISGRITVNLLNGFNPGLGSFFDVLSADTITNNASVIGTTPGGNFFAPSTVVGGDGREVLRLVVVPEPCAAALMAAATLTLAVRRGRRDAAI